MANTLRIFIAEDEGVILGNFKMRVEKMGHQVVGIAMDGLEAKKKILELKPELILMDINIPTQDGLSVLEEINRLNPTPSIIITGYYSEELIERTKKAGVFGYLIKPVDEKQLEAAINIAQMRYSDMKKQTKKTEEVSKALAERKKIERAKGILMDRFMLKEAEAMKRLQKMSKDHNIKLSLVADRIIESEKLLDLKDDHAQN